MIAAILLLLFALGVEAQSPELVEKSERGMKLMAEHKFGEAASIYRQLVQAMPDNPGLLLNLGMALHLAGHSREALAPLQNALKLDASIAPAWLFLGASYLDTGNAERALQPLEKFVRLQPEDAGGRQTLGDALFATNKFLEAADQYKKLSELETNNPHAWYGLNRSYTASARVAFQAVENAAPESAWWFALVADERVRRQQLHSAFFFYKKVALIDPNLPGLHASIADVYKKTGHPDWAEAERQRNPSEKCEAAPQACDFFAGRYEAILQNRGKTPEALFWQSRAYARLAENAFQRLEQLPDNPEIHELRAGQRSAQRQYRESAEEWRKAVQYAPNDEHLKEGLLSSVYRSGDYPAALKLVDEQLRENPSSAELNLLKGDILVASQDTAKAIPCLRTALKYDPNLLAAHRALGQAYMQAGLQSDAISHLQAAASIDEDGSLHYQLARAFQAIGKPELAKKALDEYERRQKADREEKNRLEQDMKITPP